MKSFLQTNRALRSGLCSLWLLECLAPVPLAARDEQGKVSNVRVDVQQNRVFLFYDLAGSRDVRYKVTIMVRSDSDNAYRYVPRDVAGDVGEGYYAGKNKKIVWNLANEFPKGLPGKNCYFEIGAEEVSSSGFGTLLWVGAGVALVGGAAAVLLLSSPDNSSSSGSSHASSGFPLPPGRP